MGRESNLIPQAHRLSVDEQSKGGRSSGMTRARRKSMKEAFDQLLSMEFRDDEFGLLSGAELIALQVFRKAMEGDLRAFELVRDSVGEKPSVKVAVNEIPQDVRDEVERIVRMYESESEDRKNVKV